MNVSYEWLRAFVDHAASPEQLRDLFTRHTATVDEIVPLRSDLAPFVVARVVEARRHPDSDHLWATRVDAGGGELLDVVCGAPNVGEGRLYPFAPVGTVMPNGMKIERRKIRGITSNGMLCSARELGLGENHEGILELETPAAPGTPLLAALRVGDVQLVLDIGANRPDLLSHLGLARELSAITGTPWHLPAIPGLGAAPAAPRQASGQGTVGGLTVRVEPATRARRYMLAVVRGVRVGRSPEWMVQRLAGVGARSINNVVDATNYVLHELGQPVHAFDLGRLGRSIAVRMATPGEKLVTLDGAERAMPASAVMIADDRAAQAVAGIMGGRDSEVGDETTDLLIEVASFDPAHTRAARTALGLSTDASYRFERGVDPEIAPVAMQRVLQIILGVAGGAVAEAPLDVDGERTSAPGIDLRSARVTQVLGSAIPSDMTRRYLERAGFTVTRSDERGIRVQAPSWRGDVSSEIDLVEEVARFHGYDAFPVEIRPFRPTTTADDPLWTAGQRVRDAAVGLGLLEARPLPFVGGDDVTHVRVGNPLSENEAYLRVSVLETLARRAEFNLAQRNGDVRLFEIGSVFAPATPGLPAERVRVGVVVMGRRRPSHFTEPQPPAFDEWDAKGIAERLGAAAFPGATIDCVPSPDGALWNIRVGDTVLGEVRRLALDAPVWASPAYGIELTLGEMPTVAPADRGSHRYVQPAAPARAHRKFAALPTVPPAEFDLALLVPFATPARAVEDVIRAAAGELLERLELFDQYVGSGVEAGHRSLAWRLTFRHPERTLRDKEIEGRRGKILGALEKELHVRQRTV